MYIKKEKKDFIANVMPVVDNLTLPSDFETFVYNTAFKDTFHVFYKKVKKNEYDCECEHCGFNFTTKKVERKCPFCNFNLKKVKKELDLQNKEYYQDIAIVQELNENEFVVRSFCYCRVGRKVEKISEYERVFCNKNFEDLKSFRMFWSYSFFGSIKSWRPGAYPYSEGAIYYPLNLEYFQKGNFKYSYFKEISQTIKLCPFKFKPVYLNFPQIEYLYKLGLTNLIKDFIMKYSIENYVNVKATNVCDFLNIDKVGLKFLINNNLGVEALKVVKYIFKENLPMDSKTYRVVRTCLFGYWSTIDLKSNDERLSYIKNYMSISSFINYASKQSNKKYFLSDYYDYLKECITLKRDLRNTKWLKPGNFKLAHELASMKIASRKNPKLYASVKEILKRYQNLVYDNDNYVVVVPKKAEEIKLEGIMNCNCVGSYIDRVANDKSIICFIRHKNEPNKSFYTVEVNPVNYKIVQCRGYHNNPTPEEAQVQAFARQWQKEVLDKLKQKAA